MIARQRQVGRNEEFYIDVREDHVNVDGQVIRVPANDRPVAAYLPPSFHDNQLVLRL